MTPSSAPTRFYLAAKTKRLGVELLAGEKITILAGFDNDQANLHEWQQKGDAAAEQFVEAIGRARQTGIERRDKKALEESRQLLRQFVANNTLVRAEIAAGRFSEAQEVSKSKNRSLVDRNGELIDQIVASQQKQLDEANAADDSAKTRATTVIAALGLLSLVVGGSRSTWCGAFRGAAGDGVAAARGRRAGGVGLDAGLDLIAVVVTGSTEQAASPRRPGLDGGDGVDDAAERRQLQRAPPGLLSVAEPGAAIA
jgi:hypothetical protein